MRRRELYPMSLDRPGMFETWGAAIRFLVGLVAFGLLVWAAIYELVKF